MGGYFFWRTTLNNGPIRGVGCYSETVMKTLLTILILSLCGTAQTSPAPQSPITIDATSLLAAYDANEGRATERYKGQKVVVTGRLTGLFVPTMDQQLKKDSLGCCTAVVVATMEAPYVHSVREAAFLPGIYAMSVEGSKFGQDEDLVVGERVTFACTVDERMPWRPKGSIDLIDCTLQKRAKTAPDSAPEAGGVFHVGGGVSPPRVVYQIDPEYSQKAREAKRQGTCTLMLVVDTAGHPTNIRVASSLGMGLDEKAIEAVKQWRFKPSIKDGHPVRVEIAVEVEFHLD